MENARTVITQVAKLSIDRSVELTADVPLLVIYKKKYTAVYILVYPRDDARGRKVVDS